MLGLYHHKGLSIIGQGEGHNRWGVGSTYFTSFLLVELSISSKSKKYFIKFKIPQMLKDGAYQSISHSYWIHQPYPTIPTYEKNLSKNCSYTFPPCLFTSPSIFLKSSSSDYKITKLPTPSKLSNQPHLRPHFHKSQISTPLIHP